MLLIRMQDLRAFRRANMPSKSNILKYSPLRGNLARSVREALYPTLWFLIPVCSQVLRLQCLCDSCFSRGAL